MKSRFITKKKNNNKKRLFIIFVIASFIGGIYLSFQLIKQGNTKINDKEFVRLVKDSSFTDKENTILELVISKIIESTNPVKVLNREYTKYLNTVKTEPVISNKKEPIIYLYNTHQTEEYLASNYAEFSVNPTVIMNNYILEDIFNRNGISSYVEESSIKEILNNNNWNYVNSYKASRILLEKRKVEYPSLKYFIDIHRDSLNKDKTTVEINGKMYAKVLFIVGLENPNYQDNLLFTERINNKFNELYPNLSKGIYQKGGEGVNGIYNQDFSEYSILIEIGGSENTTSEVLNTALAFSEVFMEIINE